MEASGRQVTNRDVAEQLAFMAQLLEIAGDDPYKIRAYERAAQEIERLSIPLAVLREEEMVRIPGIGVQTAKKVKEIVENGTFRELAILRTTIPVSLIELLGVSGVGPRTLNILWKRLGIQTLDDLERAAKSHRIRAVKGFGAKKEENILKGVQQFRARTDRLTRPQADIAIRRVAEAFSEGRYAVAGSYRRGTSTLGNIDIVTMEDHYSLLSRIRAVADDLIDEGEQKVSIRTKGVRVDVRFAKPEQYGSMLLYFTGSREFNIRLREVAVQQGYWLNEYGLEDCASGHLHTFRNEEDLFAFLAMAPIPPELRENRGEIELALQQTLPDLVDFTQVRGDLHVHTTWSDGRQSVNDVAEVGDRLGYEYIAITDHSSRLNSNALERQRLEIERANRNHTCQILAGSEVDIRSDGKLGLPNPVLGDLDLVIASVHSGFGQDEDVLTRRIITAMENEHVDIIGHPTGRLLGYRPPYSIDLMRVIARAAETETALEINASPHRLDLDDIYIRRAKEKGVKLAVGTDSHRRDEFSNIHYGITLARRGWCAPADILNTRTVTDLLEW
jgi:DNA polymerase (family X)